MSTTGLRWAAASLLLGAVGRAPVATAAPTVVTAPEVVWEDLNPARGDRSPRAGTLWGDRKRDTATGFLLAPTDGFESPPHIHNITYRGVVLRGLIHNDDPGAAREWMPAGSFWTQPAGEVHITAARGSDTLAYIEIDSGPYLVHPVDAATDNGERALQLQPAHLVWVDPPGGAPAAGLKLAYLWGEPLGPGSSGTFLRLPGGAAAQVRSVGTGLGALVVQGSVAQQIVGAAGGPLEQGSHLRTADTTPLRLACAPGADCVLYLRAEGGFAVEAAEAAPL